ncbi:MAG: hypothetical protein KAW12_00695 [Candidatus Aminicenantes bacterium]|nr:hypothetical protein [Candidatus Aminicenantes bacterium]
MSRLKSLFNEKGFYELDFIGKISMGELYRCPECDTPIAIKPTLPPFNIKLKGKNFGDLCAGVCYEFLVSKRFAALWKESGLMGLEILDYPVNIKKTGKFKNIDTPEYIMVRPDVTLTHLNEKESGLIIKDSAGCNKCKLSTRKKVERLRIDESTWDGQDIFYLSGLYGVLVVTEKFVEFVEKHQFTNFVLVHQDDYNE